MFIGYRGYEKNGTTPLFPFGHGLSYTSFAYARVPRSPKELKGFAKAMLQAGESQIVTVPLDARAFMYYDAQAKEWLADAGTFDILVGSSSAKVEVHGEVVLGAMTQ